MIRSVFPIAGVLLAITSPVAAQDATISTWPTPRLSPQAISLSAPAIPTALDAMAEAPTETLPADPETAAGPGATPVTETSVAATAVAELTSPETFTELDYQEIDPASDRGQQVIAEVSAYLNNLNTLHGRFLQVASNGTSASGDVFLQRPGKARLSYDDPHPTLLVSDGATVAHFDRELETMDRVALRRTPLHLFLKRNVDLAKDTDITSIVAGPGEIVLSANDPDGEMQGEVGLVFTAPALELREWIIVDEFGSQVRVILSEIQHGMELDPTLFVLRDERGERRGGGRR